MPFVPVSRWMLEKCEAWGRMGRIPRRCSKSYLWRMMKEKNGYPGATGLPPLTEKEFYEFDRRLVETCNPLELAIMRQYFVERKGFKLISRIVGQPVEHVRYLCFSLIRRLEQLEGVQ